MDSRNIFKKIKSLLHGHFKYFKNTFFLIFDFKRLFLETFSATDIARNINSGQKVHLNRNRAVSLACFAPPAFYVEREPARAPSADPRFFAFGKQLADKGEHAGIGCGI